MDNKDVENEVGKRCLSGRIEAKQNVGERRVLEPTIGISVHSHFFTTMVMRIPSFV